jgi:formylglycine-generating enzyme required for sulfatase activity
MKSKILFFSFIFSIPLHGHTEEFVNSLGMKFVLIPSGSFLMGRTESIESMQKAFPEFEVSRFHDLADELPAHEVKIDRAFFLGKYEVTVGEFKKFLQKSGYTPESIRDKSGGYGYNKKYDPDTTIKKDAFEGRDPKYSWKNPGFSQTDRDPVTNITWNDAVNLAKWLSKKEGKKYRLPTEAEWEYACLAKTQSRFGVVDDPQSLSFYANLYDQSAVRYWGKWNNFAQKDSDGFPFTAPVGSLKPNSYGLHDMNGNVWEWVSDFYSDQYPSDAVTNPTGPVSGDLRVRRGGSWHTWALYSRCQFRNWNTADTRYTLVGVRLLLEKGDRHPRIKQAHRHQNKR